jgi:AraC family transcriptional regulator
MYAASMSEIKTVEPIPYLGQTLCERRVNGLTANLGHYPPVRQPLHVHAHPSFSVIIAGKARDRSRSQTYEQGSLTAVFHPTTEPNATENGPGGVLAFTLECTLSWLERHEIAEKDLGGYQLLSPSVWSRLACLRLVGTAFEPGPGAEADLETQALELLEPLVNSPSASEPRRAPRWLRRAEEFLRVQFRSPISLRSVAREAGVHPVYFARVFRRHHGCSVSAYLRALRLADAAEVVLQQGCSLAEAAYAAGFADQAHLTRRFTQVLGFPPKTVRRLRSLLQG